MFKKIIKRLLNSVGYECKKIIRTPINNIPAFLPNKLDNWLTSQNYKTVIDVGANEGQFALMIRSLLPNASIISFEPIQEVFEKLKQRFSDDKKFIAYNCGLGDISGEISFHLNTYSPSSSIFEMNEIHKEIFNYTTNDEFTTIKIEKLDSIVNDEEILQPFLLKIDVQGYEKFVLEGGSNIASKANTIILEISFKELYKDQPTFDEIYSILRSMNFSYIGNLEQLTSPVNGEILQADAIFKKNV